MSPCTLSVEMVAQLGAVGDSVSIISGRLIQVAPLAGGWIALERGRFLLNYDHDGNLRGRLTSAGSGPEEIRNPMSVTVGPGDSVWIADSQGRWVVVDSSGIPRRTVTDPHRPIDGFTPSGIPFKLYAAGIQKPDGTVEASLFVRRWSELEEPGAHDRIGPGATAIDQGARVGAAAYSSLAVAMADTVFLVAGNWGTDGRPTAVMPGEAGIMHWTPSAWQIWVSARELATAARHLELPSNPYMIPRAIGRDGGRSGYWLLSAVQRVSSEDLARQEEDSGGTWQSQPVVKNAAFDGLAWHLDGDGKVKGVGTFDEYPEGMAGPDHFFTIVEDPASGIRRVRVYRLSECSVVGA